MSAIRFEVWWSDVSCEIIAPELEQNVGAVIELIRKQVGLPLPEEDSLSHSIEYALYKDEQGHRIALRRRLQLQRANIQPDDQMYLANRKAPWWEPTSQLDDDEPLPDDLPLPKPIVFATCRLRLAPNCVISVPADGIQIDREYLMDHLPRMVLAREEAFNFTQRGSRLMRVSREPHCTFLRGEAGWVVHIYKPTYINGKMLPKGSDTALTDSTTMVLGRDGWPIEVHLDAHIEGTKA